MHNNQGYRKLKSSKDCWGGGLRVPPSALFFSSACKLGQGEKSASMRKKQLWAQLDWPLHVNVASDPVAVAESIRSIELDVSRQESMTVAHMLAACKSLSGRSAAWRWQSFLEQVTHSECHLPIGRGGLISSPHRHPPTCFAALY